MSLLELLGNNTFLPKEVFLDIQIVDKRIGEDFCYKNDYVIGNTSAHYLREIHLQNEIAASENKISLGFENLEKQLANCQPEDLVSMRFIESPSWGGRAYFLEAGRLLGVFLGEKKNKNYKAPPEWDGSLEALREYNKNLDM